MYAKLEEIGSYGPQFQNLDQVWRSSSCDVMLARLRVPASLNMEHYHVHPAVLDSVFHMSGFIPNALGQSKAWVPAQIKSVELHQQSPARGNFVDSSDSEEDGPRCVWASVRVIKAEEKLRELDFTVYDAHTGNPMMSLDGFVIVPLKPLPPASALYETHWTAAPMNGSEKAS